MILHFYEDKKNCSFISIFRSATESPNFFKSNYHNITNIFYLNIVVFRYNPNQISKCMTK